MCLDIIKNFLRKYVGILFIVLIAILLTLGLTNYVTSQLKANEIDIIFKLISINLTLFGFCLVGNIFENKKLKLIEKKLFMSSMLFLTSTLFLFGFLGLYFLPNDNQIYAIMGAFAPYSLIGSLFITMLGLLAFYLDLDKLLDETLKINNSSKIKTSNKNAKNKIL